MVLKATYPYLAHYWSLGVEEQFYLFWPWVIRTSKTIIVGIIGVFLFFFGLKVAIRFTLGGEHYLYEIIYLSKFQCMAIGGAGAYFYYKTPHFLEWMKHWFVQWLAWAYIGLVILGESSFVSLVDPEILGVITTVIIVQQVTIDRPLINLEGKIFNVLGKISFGIYVYHPLILHYVLGFFEGLEDYKESLLLQVICYTICFGVTILVSYLSYEYFEKFFLKIKTKYMIVKSSPNKNEEVLIPSTVSK